MGERSYGRTSLALNLKSVAPLRLHSYRRNAQPQSNQRLRAFSMIPHQSLPNWQKALVPSDESYLPSVADALIDAVDRLTFAHNLLENTGLSKTYIALFTATCDALHYTQKAIAHCEITEEKK